MSKFSNIEIKLQIEGPGIGTLAWFQKLFADSEFVIRNTRFGIPGLFLHVMKNRNGVENKYYEGNYWLCHVATDSDFDTGCRDATINSIRYVFPYVYAPKYSNQFSLFDYPVTPACEKAAEELLAIAVSKFAEWYEIQ